MQNNAFTSLSSLYYDYDFLQYNSGSKVMAYDKIFSEPRADWFSDVSADERNDTETLNADVATNSSGIAHVVRPGHSQQNVH
jgi:hypothetical protein